MAATVPTQPAAPLKVTADKTQITVKWVAPSDDGGTSLTGYILQWNEGGEGTDFFDLFTCDQNTLVYTRDSLLLFAGMPFKFRVIASNY